PNAFSGTELHDLLQNHGRLDLIVCGFMTHSSVSTTVRAAKDYGYRCTLADSACATRDIPTLNGGVLSAAKLSPRAAISARCRSAALRTPPFRVGMSRVAQALSARVQR
ncbi:isochorismatase family protein, partial [Pseudomonas aeruginosa]